MIDKILYESQNKTEIMYAQDAQMMRYGNALCQYCDAQVGHIGRSVMNEGVILLDFHAFHHIESENEIKHWGQVNGVKDAVNVKDLTELRDQSFLTRRIDAFWTDKVERFERNESLIRKDGDILEQHLIENVDSTESYPFTDLTKMYPKPYQQSLYLEAMSQESNALIVLPTGCGKTLVAAMIMSKFLRLNPDRQVIFLCETNALAMQQHDKIKEEYFEDNISFSLLVGGRMEIQNQASRQRKELELSQELCDADVIVGTAGSYLRVISESCFLDSEKASLIVLDEAHHCAKKHAFKEVMDFFNEQRGEKPKVIGLTAFPGSAGTEDETVTAIRDLCERLNGARVLFPKDELDMDYHNQQESLPLELTQVQRTSEETKLMYALITYILRRLQITTFKGPWKPCTELLTEMMNKQAHILGRQGVDLIQLFVALVGIEEVGGHLIWNVILDLDQSGSKWKYVDKDVADIFEKHLIRAEKENLVGSCYQNIKITLENEMQRSKDHGEKFAALLFVSQRMIARKLKQYFDEDGIKSDYIVGRSEMSLPDQKDKLVQLRNGDINVLISTTVCGEGIDIPQCNLVLCTTLPSSTLNFVQVRGRARASMKSSSAKAKFFALVRPGEHQPRFLISKFEKHEKLMYKALEQMTENGRFKCFAAPKLEQMKRKIQKVDQEIRRPIAEKETNYRAMLNQFCQKKGYVLKKQFSASFRCEISLQVPNFDEILVDEGSGMSKKAAEEIAAEGIWCQLEENGLK